MKIKLLLLIYIVTFSITAQTTHQINWTFGANGGVADLTIETGDTVEWVWGDPANHTVSSLAGSTETFSSGTLNGSGTIYSRTFNNIGSNNYQCNFHPVSMNGIITVEAPLSTDEFTLKTFSISPNPARSRVVLELPYDHFNKVDVKIYNVLGKEVYSRKFSSASIDISNWSNGVYMVRLSSDDVVLTKRLIKQ